MNFLITGACGFIGSHVSQTLLEQGHAVKGVDCFVDFYDRRIKELNLSSLQQYPQFSFMEEDVNNLTREELSDAEVIVHQAAQAGVRSSWGKNFEVYTHHNVLATQKLLELAAQLPLKRFVYASSSSVYGKVDKLPLEETDLPQPISPYGVSKLAAEHLCNLYYTNFDVPAVSLRYFTVYGPGQRPDMAFHRFFRALLKDEEIKVFGDGEQTRDFTYIDDIVKANLNAVFEPELEGQVFNIAGGHRISLLEAIRTMETITGKNARIRYLERQKGDPRDTYADTTLAQKHLSYKPATRLEDGLSRQAAYMEKLIDMGL